MRKFGFPVLALMAALFIVGVWSDGYAGALGLSSVTSPLPRTWANLVVKVKKKHDKNDQDKCTKKKISCPVGYVTLDKPNKYGACCEPKEGLPPTPTEQEAEKCKFPGQIGTPPNCTCPDGTEFLGFKGCVKFTTQQYCSDNNQPGDRLLNSTELIPFRDKCKSQYTGTPSCAGPFATTGPGLYRCCCYYRVYAQ